MAGRAVRFASSPSRRLIEARTLAEYCYPRYGLIADFPALRARPQVSLLKNELRAIGWGQAERCAAPNSRGTALIAMMQTADLGEGNNIACGGKLHATRPWAVLVEREMRSGVMMILKIARQYAAQVTLVEDDNMI